MSDVSDDCTAFVANAKVIGYAKVGAKNAHTKNTKQIVGGKLMGAANMMIIAQYPNDTAFYLFGCYGGSAETMTDTWHQELEDAVSQMNYEYKNLSRNLVWYVDPSGFGYTTGNEKNKMA